MADCLVICLIDDTDECGVLNIRDAKVKDYIAVNLYDLGLLFMKVLLQSLEVLLIRNGLWPED